MPKTPERIQFLTDVLTTAVEGGIGYWSEASEYTWSAEDADKRGVTLDYEDEDGEFARERVTLDTIARGIRQLLDDPAIAHFDQTVSRANAQNDCCPEGADDDIDADYADTIVQYGLFGKLVFG